MTETLATQITVLGPALWIAALGLLALVVDLFAPKQDRLLRGTVLIGLGFIFLMAACRCCGTAATAFNGMIGMNSFTYFFDLLFIGIALFTVMLSGPYFERTGLKTVETLSLLLFATTGAMIMTIANDFMILFLGLELMSVCLYVLAGMLRERPKSNEGALKYFLLGAFSTGFFLYGIALLYGVSGSTRYNDIAMWVVQQNGQMNLIFWAGVGLLMIGFLFKTATVPFHFWSPDAYEGAPTPITGFFSAGPKAAAFGSLAKIFAIALPTVNGQISDMIAIFAILTMFVGNFVAIQQKSIKRMLAYSSIAHAGYLLVALVAANENGGSALMLYLAAYAATNLGAFTIAYLVNRKVDGEYGLEDYNGLAIKHPYLAALMALFMISLAGIPPTGGFLGKYYIFFAVVRSGNIGVAIAMALFSAVSVYYYLRVIVHMYMKPAADQYVPIKPGLLVGVGLGICAILILAIGVQPDAWLKMVMSGIHSVGM